MWLCMRRRFPPLGLHMWILNSFCVLIPLIHTKHKYKKMKSWTDPMSPFPWGRAHQLDRPSKKRVTNIRVVKWNGEILPSRCRILAEIINTKILTRNHADSPHSHPFSLTPDIRTTIPRIPTLITCISTLIPRVPILIPRVPITPLIRFPDSLFQLLQISKNNITHTDDHQFPCDLFRSCSYTHMC